MNESWLEIEVSGVRSRADLRSGLTRVGGVGCDVVMQKAPPGELHVWSTPPKVIHISGDTALEFDRKPVVEAELEDGDSFRWGTISMVFRTAQPVLEELAVPAPPLAAPAASFRGSAAGPPADPRERAWDRVRAGLAIDLDTADKKVVSRWQEAVLRNEFDPDACARELLANGALSPIDPRLVERSGRLLRDFLMASLHRGVHGASRKIRAQARSGTAYLVANAIAISIYTLIVLVVMVLMRLKWGTSFDGIFDFILGRGQG